MKLTVELSPEQLAQLRADLDELGLPDVAAGIEFALELVHRRAEEAAERARMREEVAAWYATHPDVDASSGAAVPRVAPSPVLGRAARQLASARMPS